MEMQRITDFPMSTVHIGLRKLQSNLRRYDDHRTRHNAPHQHRRYQNWWFSDADVLSRTPKKWRNQEENIQQCIRFTEEVSCQLITKQKKPNKRRLAVR
ncbi:hypothetical protein Hanom_Chr03g00256111 [Helianthus anomalus]